MSNSSMLDKLYYLEETKQQLKESIERRGVEISSDTPFRDFSQKIDEIKGEDYEGKAYLLEILYAKNPDIEKILNIDSTLTEIANIVMTIGPMNVRFKEKITTKVLTGDSANVIKPEFNINFIPVKRNEGFTNFQHDISKYSALSGYVNNIVNVALTDSVEQLLEIPIVKE